MTATHLDAPADDAALRRARLGVLAVFVLHGVLFASWTAHIPLVKAQLGLDDGTLGLALLGTPVGSVAAVALTGYLVPRVGSRTVVIIGVAGYAVSGPLVGVAGSVPTLALALFAWGVFQGALDVSMNTQAIAVERARGRPLMNGMHAGWSVGAFAGAGLGTLGVALGVSLALQLLVVGVPMSLVAIALAWGMLPDRRADEPAATRDDDGAGRTLSAAMLVLGAVVFASMLCEGAAADWSSVYLRDSLGAGAVVGGLGYTAFAFAMVLVRFFGDPLLRRHPAQRLLPVLAGVATVGVAIALLAATPAVSILAFVLLGFGLGAVVPTAFSAAGRLPGVHPGVGVAGVSGLGWAGFVCGPPLIGQLASASSLSLALVTIPVLTAFIALSTARVAALRMPAPDRGDG